MQGLGGAVVSAVALSLIMIMFTEAGERAKAMGIFGFVMSGGGTIGVLLGGVLTDLLSWHWIFLVNLPIGVVRLRPLRDAASRYRGPAPAATSMSAGAVTVTAALMLAVYAIVNGNDTGWLTGQTLGLLGAAVVLLGVFLVIESRVASPLMPLSLFRLPQRGDVERRRRSLGGRHVRLVLHVRAVPAAGARLQPVPGRAGLPAAEPDHGRLLRRPVGEAGDEVRHPRAVRRWGCCSRPSAWCCSRGRRSTATT